MIEEDIYRSIRKLHGGKPLLVAFDGIDASGKTTLADSMAAYMEKNGHLVPERISIDGFHNERSIRLRRGGLSPEGYYYDSFDYPSLISKTLGPIKRGAGEALRNVYDYRIESAAKTDRIKLLPETVVLFDGIFLLRKELLPFWDLTVFVDVSFPESLRRAKERDLSYFGSVEEIERRYGQRYHPGQELYFREENPRDKAMILLDNEDYADPAIVRDLALPAGRHPLHTGA